jgi:hypothetical protein
MDKSGWSGVSESGIRPGQSVSARVSWAELNLAGGGNKNRVFSLTEATAASDSSRLVSAPPIRDLPPSFAGGDGFRWRRRAAAARRGRGGGAPPTGHRLRLLPRLPVDLQEGTASRAPQFKSSVHPPCSVSAPADGEFALAPSDSDRFASDSGSRSCGRSCNSVSIWSSYPLARPSWIQSSFSGNAGASSSSSCSCLAGIRF